MNEFRLSCPRPYTDSDVILMAHGGGGRMAQRLIDSVFLSRLGNEALGARHDAGFVGELAMSTDSFVVRPWRFPGGDIGSLAVHGTVNDLAMGGARAEALSAAFILEEGFPIASLEEVVGSMQSAADAAGVAIVAGDTKVVDRGKGDGVYIATSGFGRVLSRERIEPTAVRAGDAVLVSGDVGRHGMAVMTARAGLSLDSEILSDSALIHEPALALIHEGLNVHLLRDCTRGGLATVLNEVARDALVDICIEEGRVPVSESVAGACELFGLDPLYVACEGRFVVILPEAEADEALRILRGYSVSAGAARIGEVTVGRGRVTLQSRLGVMRVLDLLSGEQMPRIC